MTQRFIPPTNFGMVEEDLYRSGQPNELNFSFLAKLKLKTIIFLSPEEPSPQLREFVEDHAIRFIHLDQDNTVGNDSVILSGSTLAEETVLQALRAILTMDNYPLLVCCNLGRHHTGTVVGCLRKLQGWNLTSIFEEYRRYAGSKVRLLNEQFIEFFDTDLMPVLDKKPPWL